MFKETKRKGFNFFRSYFDVYNELNKEDKLKFMEALLQRQFLGTKPKDLKGMSKFAYISQTNSIDSQVKGYEDKTKTRLDGRPYIKGENTPCQPPTDGGTEPPTVQEEEKGKEEVEYTIPEISVFMIHLKDYLKKEPDRYVKVRTRMIDTYNAWNLNDWKDGNDKKIKNWKTKALMQLRYIK